MSAWCQADVQNVQPNIDLSEQPYSPARYVVHRSDKLHVALGHSRPPLRRLEDLTHGPADVGLNGAFKPLQRLELRIDISKTWKHVLKQQLYARTFVDVLEFGGKRRLHRAAACVSKHHE